MIFEALKKYQKTPKIGLGGSKMMPGGLRMRPESPLGGLMALSERSWGDFGPFRDGPEAKKKRSSKNEDI